MLKFVKPAFAGIAALSVAALIAGAPFLLWEVLLKVKYPATDGYYVVTHRHWHVWPALCASFLIFSVGFFWQYAKPTKAIS